MWLSVTASAMKSILKLRTIQSLRGRSRRRLVRDYLYISFILISGGLITSGILEIYFHYQESREQLSLLQQEVASGAAFKIEQFIHEIEAAMRATTKSRELAERGLTRGYRFELKKLLYLEPAVTEVVAVDIQNRVRVYVSRLTSDLQSRRDLPGSQAFAQAKEGRAYLGPVYFVRNSEPYITVAVPIERFAGEIIGVLEAEVNLKHVWDVVSSIRIGKAGFAYAVTRSGDLIAHPDISLVLQRPGMAQLKQVQTAFQIPPGVTKPTAMVSSNIQGAKVFTSSAVIPGLDWAVVIEQPVDEAYQPLYASMLRTSSVLLIGFGMALLASVFVARRVVQPLGKLRQGVDRIAKGDLDVRLEVKTGDEIETLAEDFNKMTAALQEAYTTLEKKVAERTQELALANQKLDEASRHKSAFVASMSHEFRTPLNAIIGFSEVLLDPSLKVTEEERTQFLTDIATSGKHLLRLINEILDLSRIEAGGMQLQIEPASLRDLVDGVQSLMRPLLAKKHIDSDFDTGAIVDAVPMDTARIQQVLLNLLGTPLSLPLKEARSGSALIEGTDPFASK